MNHGAAPPERLPRLRPWLARHGAALLIAAVAIAVFWPVLRGGFVYDDQLNFQRNAPLRDGDLWQLCTRTFYRAHMPYWRPVASLLMAIGFRLGDLAGVHTIALLAHAAGALVVARLATRILQDARSGLATAVVFLVHPVHVESVGWASALSDPLWALFALHAVASIVAWRDSARATLPLRAAGWLMLALLSKESAVATVPLMLAVLAWLPGRPVCWRSLLPTLAAVLAAWVLLRSSVLEHPFGAARAWPAFDGSGLATSADLVLRHLWLLAVPFPLTPFHAFGERACDLPLAVVMSASFAAFASLAAGFRRLSPQARITCAFLVLPLLPVLLQYRAVGDYPVAERYVHLPALGLCLMLARLAAGRRLWLVAPAVACALLSFDQCWVWQDQRSFVAHCLRRSPDDATVHVLSGNLDLAAAQAGDDAALDRALAAYDAALHLSGAGTGSARKRAAIARTGAAWCELLREQHHERVDPAQLITGFREALACDDSVVAGWVGLGVANALARRFADAERCLRHAIDLDDTCPEAWFNLGYMQAELGRRPAAQASLRQALSCDRDLDPAKQLLGRLR